MKVLRNKSPTEVQQRLGLQSTVDGLGWDPLLLL